MKTINKVICHDGYKIFDYAEEFFIKACGFNFEKANHKRMLSEAIEILHANKETIHLKCVYSIYGGEAYHDNKIAIDNIELSCNGFSGIKAENVEGIWLSVITAGEWKSAGGIKEQVYMDTWGTAFADGARIYFERELMKNLKPGQYLSDPFGPGYYGMPSADTKKFSQLLDMGQIGVKVLDSGIMVPEKTIAAAYLITDSKEVFPPSSCAECFGAVGGCNYCQKR